MQELIKAYAETDYVVYDPRIVIKVGEISPELDELLAKHNCTEWSYITAWNPYSEITDRVVNDQRNAELKLELSNYFVFEGEGRGSDPKWEPEKSLLIVGIARNNAIELGKKYRQNAIVSGKVNSPAELLWIREWTAT